MASKCVTMITDCELGSVREEDVFESSAKKGTELKISVNYMGGSIDVIVERGKQFPIGVTGTAKFISHPMKDTVVGQKKAGGYWKKDDNRIDPGLLLEFIPDKA